MQHIYCGGSGVVKKNNNFRTQLFKSYLSAEQTSSLTSLGLWLSYLDDILYNTTIKYSLAPLLTCWTRDASECCWNWSLLFLTVLLLVKGNCHYYCIITGKYV